MWSQRIQPVQLNHVALRVRDLEGSAAFYCEILGFELRPAAPSADGVLVCAAPAASSLHGFSVVLMRGLPSGSEPIGMDHLSLKVPKIKDLQDLYAAAVARGVPAIQPRIYGGHYQTFIFDPDGYKIEVVSSELPREKSGGTSNARAMRASRRPSGAAASGRPTVVSRSLGGYDAA